MLVLAIFCTTGMFVNISHEQHIKEISIGDCYLNPTPMGRLSFIQTDLLSTTAI